VSLSAGAASELARLSLAAAHRITRVASSENSLGRFTPLPSGRA